MVANEMLSSTRELPPGEVQVHVQGSVGDGPAQTMMGRMRETDDSRLCRQVEPSKCRAVL